MKAANLLLYNVLLPLLSQGGPSDGMYFGAGRLDDLLPDVPLPEEEYEQPDETQDEEAAAHGSKGFGSHSGGFGSGLNSIPSSQWPLLEETEGHEATQLVLQQQGQAAGMMTAASRKVLRCASEEGGGRHSAQLYNSHCLRNQQACVLPLFCNMCSSFASYLAQLLFSTASFLSSCSIFRDRLQPGAATQEDGVAPSLSLFGLMKEGQLSRSAAAMLFYQVCGEWADGLLVLQQCLALFLGWQQE